MLFAFKKLALLFVHNYTKSFKRQNGQHINLYMILLTLNLACSMQLEEILWYALNLALAENPTT